jgi:hypothetical protein
MNASFWAETDGKSLEIEFYVSSIVLFDVVEIDFALVKQLMIAEKRFVKRTQLSIQGSAAVQEKLLSDAHGDVFHFDIVNDSFILSAFTTQLRAHTRIQLYRLDMSSKPHPDPVTRRKIDVPHIHEYHPDYGMRHAKPLEEYGLSPEMPKTELIKSFFAICNIKPIPVSVTEALTW